MSNGLVSQTVLPLNVTSFCGAAVLLLFLETASVGPDSWKLTWLLGTIDK